MKTSEIESLLRGVSDWQIFCSLYKDKKSMLLSRKDGAATSGELGLIFDTSDVVVTFDQIAKLRNVALRGQMSLSDARFLFNVVALSGFEFESEAVEDVVFAVSSLSSQDSDEIKAALMM